MSKYTLGLGQVPANFQPLTSLNFIARSGQLYTDRIAIIHGEKKDRLQPVLDFCRNNMAKFKCPKTVASS